jgi:flagellar assembly factor FliW
MTVFDFDGVIDFADGLPGFEACRRFVLLAAGPSEPLAILRGLGPDAPSFLVTDPAKVTGEFHADLSDQDLARLGADTPDGLLWLTIISAQPDGSLTANLRAPVVVNAAARRGIQLIPADSAYAFDHPLSA